MKYTTFVERQDRLSKFLTFGVRHLVAEAAEESTDEARPQLSYLRVEFSRIRPGMSDFIIRVATPKYDTVKESNTVISIRGNRSLTKYDAVRKLSEVIISTMKEKKDSTHEWETSDPEHLADLLVSSLKYFAVNTNTENLQFTTEALS